jgi:YebC/PmpR family DNA-binding regulatory protein
MSGHSHWATIKHKKQAADQKKGKLFSKLARQVMVLARSGGDNPEFNPALDKAMKEAKRAGMPKDRIDEAVKKGAGKLEGQNLEQKTYEGKGPAGVMLIIEVLTDNSNRTSMEIRKLLERNNGDMVKSGAAMNLFERRGIILIEGEGVSEDKLMEVALEAGAEDFEQSGDGWTVTTAADKCISVSNALEKEFKIVSSDTPFVAKYNEVDLSDADAQKLLKLIGNLDDHDDVQAVHHNGKIPESVSS